MADVHAPGGIRRRNPRNRAAAVPCLRLLEQQLYKYTYRFYEAIKTQVGEIENPWG
jgi:hypothetical protein